MLARFRGNLSNWYRQTLSLKNADSSLHTYLEGEDKIPEALVSEIVPHKWPLFKNKQWNDAIFKYMQSYNNFLSPNINMTSIMFITGTPKAGKSWLAQQALNRFKQTSLPKVIVEYDIPAIASFEVILFTIEQEIINAIIAAESRGDISLSTEELMNIVFRFYDKGLFEL